MKKTILSLAVLFASMSGFSVVAQTQSNPTTKATTETQKAANKKKAPRHNPFEGLGLTEKQQSELQALHASRSGEARKGGKTADKQNKKQLTQEEKQARRQQLAEQRKARQEQRQARMEQRKQNRQDYLAKVNAILTPEQYVKFLENNYCDRGIMNGRGHGHMKCKAHKTMAKNKDCKRHGKGKVNRNLRNSKTTTGAVAKTDA